MPKKEGNNMKVDFNNKEFTEFIKENNEFIMKRKNEICLELEKNNCEYKEMVDKHSNLYNSLIEKYKMEDIEELEGTCMEMYELENLYLYIQGFIDGITFKKNLKDE